MEQSACLPTHVAESQEGCIILNKAAVQKAQLDKPQGNLLVHCRAVHSISCRQLTYNLRHMMPDVRTGSFIPQLLPVFFSGLAVLFPGLLLAILHVEKNQESVDSCMDHDND